MASTVNSPDAPGSIRISSAYENFLMYGSHLGSLRRTSSRRELAYNMHQEYHEQLSLQAEANLDLIYKRWKTTQGKLEPFLLTWPSEPVQTSNGSWITGACQLTLPKDKAQWKGLLVEAIVLTSPKAMLLLEQNEKDVKLILETPEGSTSWVIPIERHGDINVLGKAARKIDTDSIGFLWQPNMAEA